MKQKHYRIIDSTNTEAKRLINAGDITENICLVADEQTAGRGRQGKGFFSPDTGLYMTVVFLVDCPISSQVTMTTRTACAVAEAIEDCTGKSVGIKWVNDIYVNDRKCCGILCEAINDYEQGRMKYIIIGIGINIYTKEWPDELKDKAGSLFNEKKSDELKQKLCETIIKRLETWIFNAPAADFLNYYKRHSIVLGKRITYIENSESKEGMAVYIDENGGLIVQMPNGKNKVLSSGEISILLD